jgi:hypothetical protein
VPRSHVEGIENQSSPNQREIFGGRAEYVEKNAGKRNRDGCCCAGGGCRSPICPPKRGSFIRWLGDKSLAWLASLAPWTGAPGSHQRTWGEKDGAQPHQSFYIQSRFGYPSSESIRKNHFQPRCWCEPGAPVQRARLGEKPGRRRTKRQPTRIEQSGSFF